MSGTPEIGSGQHTLRGARTPAEDAVEHRAHRCAPASPSDDLADAAAWAEDGEGWYR